MAKFQLRSFTRTTRLLLVTAAILLPLVPSSSYAQTSDATTEAKQHSQNAAAAIARNDWQTAKNELLQAVKLAPSNAVLHYDLALAYSHTGSPKSALAELNKALQLGLPAEQKQAAEQLKKELTIQTASAKPTVKSSEGVNSSSSRASTAEILDWINDKLASSGTTNWSMRYPDGDTKTSYWDETFEEIEGCSFTMMIKKQDLEAIHKGERNQYGEGVAVEKVRVDLSKLRSDVQVRWQDADKNSQVKGLWEVSANVSNASDPITSSSYVIEGYRGPGHYRDDKYTYFVIWLPESSKDLAPRIGNALRDAIVNCGGKQVKDLY